MIKQKSIKESAKNLATKVAPLFQSLNLTWQSDYGDDYIPNSIDIYEELLRLYSELSNEPDLISIECGRLKVEITKEDNFSGSIIFSFVVEELVLN